MINRKAPRGFLRRGACIAFLLKRRFYVQGSLLSVALYPKARAKVRNKFELRKYMAKNLRKRYVNDRNSAKEKGYRCSPGVSE